MQEFRNIEFYNTPGGEVSVKEEGKPSYPLNEKSREIIEYFLTMLIDFYPEAYAALMELYSKSNRNKLYFEFRVVRRFIRCNFGEYDYCQYDVDEYGRLRFEEVRCPLRGECQHEGVICKPKFSTNITEREMEVYRLIVQGYDANAIAKELFISPTTVNRHRENIKAKIQVKTVLQMTNYWYENGLDSGECAG